MSQEASYLSSCFYPHANDGSSKEHFLPFAARKIREEEEAFPNEVVGQGCQLQGAVFWVTEPQSCTKLRRAERLSKVITDSPKPREVFGGLSVLARHLS